MDKSERGLVQRPLKTDKLFKGIMKLKSLDKARRCFRDLLEIGEFARRWEAARMLAKKTPYSEIEKEAGMTSTAIARISKWLNKRVSGYKLLIEKFGNQVNHHSPA